MWANDMPKKTMSAFLLLMVIISGHKSVAMPTCLPVTGPATQQVAGSLAMYVDELPQIPKVNGYTLANRTFSSGRLTIGMYQTKWKFHRDLPDTTVFAYGTSAATATIPGPTIEAIEDTPTYITWENHLPQSHILPWDTSIPIATPNNGGVPTVVHLHGGIHAPHSDGHPAAWFTANFSETGSTWSQQTYNYPNVHHAGNLWYHDHALGYTRINLLAGLTGAYVIRDPGMDALFKLPSGPEFDRHLVLADKTFYNDGSIYMNCTGNVPSIHQQWQPEYFGDVIIVNGKAWPYLQVLRRKYRFRIINTSNARYFRLSLTNGLSFTVIGADTSYLTSPVSTQSIILAPSEIADVIVDFSATTATESLLNNDAPYPYPTGLSPDQFNGRVMKFIIQAGPTNPPDNSTIPPKIKTYSPSTIKNARQIRYITLYENTTAGESTNLYVNGKRFEDPVTETPKSGSTEVWEVINLTSDNHPFHMHLATFQAVKVQCLVDVNTFTNCMKTLNDAVACNITGQATGKVVDIPAYEKTWKNTVKMEPGCKTTLVVKFTLVGHADAGYPFVATGSPGYVYHCHILDHEDNAMIRPMQLVA
ncbi:hypothetical protein SAY87_021372 [Trapa incisa]|uniref:Uncharacterized protein n=1 Tax=Trapa incisa TaxID=236973 RepID=A0AAN7PR79_9MYRT|nr:hypothetical protein SAY87_021364 [Trapa incisa]KAK4752574.1 hypothetical protein SAY87_021372 [Trapa incisa]